MRISLLLTLLVAGACAAPAPEPVEFSGSGGRIFHNGAIYLDVRLSPVEAVLVEDGRVSAAGELDDLQALVGTESELVDLQGAVAVPGLQDAHGHLVGLGESLESVDLVGTRSFEEVVARVVAQAATQPAGTWITGRGWDQSLWQNSAFPSHAALSRAVPDHPVLIRRVDGHAALANLRAMELAGLLDSFPVPELEGGRVEVDGEGRPTGLLVDTAMGLVGRHVPAPDRASIRRWIELAQAQLLSEGLVAMHDMGVSADTAELLQEMVDEGVLKLRVVAYLSASAARDPETRAIYPRPSDEDPASTLRVIGVKFFMDGAMGSRGAALLADYHDAPGERGLLRMPAEEFEGLVEQAAAAGLQPASHAIGDRANRIVLDVYERRMQEDPLFASLRPRVEHAQLVSEADWGRFDRSGIVPSMQPRHATSDMRWAKDRVGEERLRGNYAWRRLGTNRAPLAFGSDFPVEPSDPLRGLYASRTRRDEAGDPPGGWLPDQRLDGVETLEAFTVGAAFAAREEDSRGKLLPGYFADMTVLSVDPIYDSPENVLAARVLMTVIDGEVVFDARTPQADE